MATVDNGIVLGRFQPLHVGHVEYLSAAKAVCRRLFVGVTNPDPQAFLGSDNDRMRLLPRSNPFSYLERHLMIEAALLGQGWAADEFCIVPAPLDAARLTHYLPPVERSLVLLTIYDAWGEDKAEFMRHLGYDVDVLWRRRHEDRAASGAQIRESICRGTPWKHLVPVEVASHVKSLADRRIRNGS